MPTALESRRALQLVTGAAVSTAAALAQALIGSPELKRAALLEGVPEIISVYAEGSGSLAADLYQDQRELAAVSGGFVPQVVILDRTVKVRRAVAWAADPWFVPLAVTVEARLAEVVQLEVARAYRDTIRQNRRQDPASVGWRRVTVGGCRFCRMLADKGAIYSKDTARFAAHSNCHCTAEPVFQGGTSGPEASAMQYLASKSSRTPAQKDALRSYLDAFYPEP
jgi:hypothetical protein